MDSLESLFSLRGHVALVTGASGGLGVECAKALAIAGADIAIVARRREKLEAVARELGGFGVKALPITADITIDENLDRVVSSTVAELGEIDILVNNAVFTAGGGGLVIAREQWDAEFAVNVTAPMMLSQKVARRLIERQRPGRIINMATIFASLANPYRMVTYATTKSAIVNLTRQLAVEWARYGINVNALSPGMIPTEGNERALAIPRVRERVESFTPLGRLGKPDEIRGALIFLASAASSYVTGSILSVDGGYTAW